MNRSDAMKAMWAKKRANGTMKNKKKYKKKGAWSKKAKERQSIRLKAYHKGKMETTGKKFKMPSIEAGASVGAKSRLLSVMTKLHEVSQEIVAISEQLG